MAMSVLLADDHPIFRQGVRALLERQGFEIVGEAGDGEEAVRLARAVPPDVAVLDLRMPSMNGVAAARAILQACPRTRVILLTMYTEEYTVLEALRVGIRGYVSKSRTVDELIRAIQEVVRGGIFLSPCVFPFLASTPMNTHPPLPDDQGSQG